MRGSTLTRFLQIFSILGRHSRPMSHEHEHPVLSQQAEQPSFTPESTASGLGIPVEHREHPTVIGFIALVNRVENLQSDCSRAQSEAGRTSDLDAPGVSPSLTDRYETAELMLRAVHAVLTDRLNGGLAIADNPGYVKGKL